MMCSMPPSCPPRTGSVVPAQVNKMSGIPQRLLDTVLSLLQCTFSLRQPEVSSIWLDRPNRHDQALAVQGRKLILHAKDCSLSTFDRAFIQQPERARKLRPRIRGLLDFHGMEHSVCFHD